MMDRPAETITRIGGRRLELYCPIDWNGARIETINLAPITYGHYTRWRAGEFPHFLFLLAELSGLDVEAFELIAFPDFDRLEEALLLLAPPRMHAGLLAGSPAPPEPHEETAPPAEAYEPPPEAYEEPPLVEPPEDTEASGFNVAAE